MGKLTSPSAKSRREALLQAAADVFFEQGYVGTSIDAIIERAGGSKRTIYSEFGNKEGLFAAIVTGNADSALATLGVDDISGRSLHETLMTFGVQLMQVYMSPTVVGIFRIAVTEANRFPELVRSFYDEGPGRTIARLAEVLEAATKRGEIETRDCALAAAHFVALIRGNFHLQVVLGIRPPPDVEEVQAFVRSAVDLFLNGFRSRGDGDQPNR